MTLRLTVLLALALTPGIAAAAPAKTDVDADEGARRTTGKVTEYIYGEDELKGEVLRPEGANINGKVAQRWKSLITIRPHFVAQMIKIADDV